MALVQALKRSHFTLENCGLCALPLMSRALKELDQWISNVFLVFYYSYLFY